MDEFKAYFSSDEIISYLCRLRVKVAKSRNKKHLIHLLTNSEKFNYHVNDSKNLLEKDQEKLNDYIRYDNQFLSELNKLLPSRKKWIVLGGKSRKNKINNQPISSSDRNFYSLIKTIKSSKKKSPNEPWLLELNKFVLDIQISISSDTYKISPPIVYPKLKKEKQSKGPNECRPISLFSLKDRIILSLTNKYLTRLFDNYFEDCSYAFRSKKNKENTSIITHHDCIKDVFEYRMTHKDRSLYVVECDMEKFYDSVNHKIIKKLYDKLIELAKHDFPQLNFNKPTHIFYQYLDSYAFNKNVPSASDTKYWQSYNIPNGEFEWVKDRILKLGYYQKIDDERIGIPQGGALSGLIANIVLNYADKEVLKTDVFYMRFCDDMLIMHPELEVCEDAKKRYVQALESLKLVPHEFNINLIASRNVVNKDLPTTTLEPFWKGKSKGPYMWDSISKNGFPWIGFVGYEINYEGHIRVRKKSFQKELKKQKKVVEEIKNAVNYGMRKSRMSVAESAIHRLIGMSVGRVSLKNFKIVSNDLCWSNGFKELPMNKYSIQQIKQLDRCRSKLYYDLIRDLKEADKDVRSKPRQIIHFNKPFSYYYQVLERKQYEKLKVVPTTLYSKLDRDF